MQWYNICVSGDYNPGIAPASTQDTCLQLQFGDQDIDNCFIHADIAPSKAHLGIKKDINNKMDRKRRVYG